MTSNARRRLLTPQEDADSPGRPGGVLAVVSDLIFESRIRTTAQTLGLPYRSVPTTQALAGALARETPALVLVDMELADGSASEAIRTARSHEPCPVVLAYLPHVRTDLAEAAKHAGADLALPRSQFSATLPDLLQRYTSIPPQ